VVPEKRLAVAMLIQAAKDYHAYFHNAYRKHRVRIRLNAHGKTSRDTKAKRMEIILAKLKTEAEAARDWYEGADAPIPFQIVAESFGWDAELYRQRWMATSAGDALMAELVRANGKKG
jgi:hypothetical protein